MLFQKGNGGPGSPAKTVAMSGRPSGGGTSGADAASCTSPSPPAAVRTIASSTARPCWRIETRSDSERRPRCTAVTSISIGSKRAIERKCAANATGRWMCASAPAARSAIAAT